MTQHRAVSTSSTDLKQIQTPHSLFGDLGPDKSFTIRWAGGKFKFVSKFEPLPVIWPSLQEAISENNPRF